MISVQLAGKYYLAQIFQPWSSRGCNRSDGPLNEFCEFWSLRHRKMVSVSTPRQATQYRRESGARSTSSVIVIYVPDWFVLIALAHARRRPLAPLV